MAAHAGAWTGEKRISLALQGGGSHGAFTWGVLDAILEDGRLDIEAITGTSAGAMNAVVLAQGMLENGRDGARQRLEDFWRSISDESALPGPVRGIVDHPDDVVVRDKQMRRGSILEVRVHPDDLGKVIGRNGRTATAFRTVVSALAGRGGARVDFVDTDRRR